MRLLFVFKRFFFLTCCFSSIALSVPTKNQGYVCDEIESVGGHALGLGNDGSAAIVDQSNIRANPAMMAFEKQYKVSAGYHWPAIGREFYQAGILDSKTSNVAAGILYTQGLSQFRPASELATEDAQQIFDAAYDSHIKRRFSLALAQSMGMIAVGLNGQYAEFYSSIDQKSWTLEKGTSLGFGLGGLLTKELKFGFSAENIANKKIEHVAPRTYRLGAAYTFFSGDITAHLDLKQRDRLSQEKLFFLEDGKSLFSSEEPWLQKPERMATFSFTARIQDLLRLLAAYGHGLQNSDRRSLSAGLVLVNKSFSISYLVNRPYFSLEKIHHAVNFSTNLSL